MAGPVSPQGAAWGWHSQVRDGQDDPCRSAGRGCHGLRPLWGGHVCGQCCREGPEGTGLPRGPRGSRCAAERGQGCPRCSDRLEAPQPRAPSASCLRRRALCTQRVSKPSCWQPCGCTSDPAPPSGTICTSVQMCRLPGSSALVQGPTAPLLTTLEGSVGWW